MGISWKYDGNVMDMSRECHANVMEMTLECHFYIMGISWRYHGNVMGLFRCHQIGPNPENYTLRTWLCKEKRGKEAKLVGVPLEGKRHGPVVQSSVAPNMTARRDAVASILLQR